MAASLGNPLSVEDKGRELWEVGARRSSHSHLHPHRERNKESQRTISKLAPAIGGRPQRRNKWPSRIADIQELDQWETMDRTIESGGAFEGQISRKPACDQDIE